jgi:hypothetical protein
LTDGFLELLRDTFSPFTIGFLGGYPGVACRFGL